MRPNDLPLLSAQFRAVTASASHPIVRLPVGDTALIKQILDVGVQTLLIPMVESAEQAQATCSSNPLSAAWHSRCRRGTRRVHRNSAG